MQDALFIFVTSGGRVMALLSSGEVVDVTQTLDLCASLAPQPPVTEDLIDHEFLRVAA